MFRAHSVPLSGNIYIPSVTSPKSEINRLQSINRLEQEIADLQSGKEPMHDLVRERLLTVKTNLLNRLKDSSNSKYLKRSRQNKFIQNLTTNKKGANGPFFIG